MPHPWDFKCSAVAPTKVVSFLSKSSRERPTLPRCSPSPGLWSSMLGPFPASPSPASPENPAGPDPGFHSPPSSKFSIWKAALHQLVTPARNQGPSLALLVHTVPSPVGFCSRRCPKSSPLLICTATGFTPTSHCLQSMIF